MRILVGTVEIGGVIPILANGFRELGHQVTTVIKERHAFFSELQYDVDISREALVWPQQIWGGDSPIIKIPRRAINRSALLTRLMPLILQHDLFVFLWAGTSLTERNQEFAILKKLGKKIMSFFCGSDVRHSSGYSQLFAPLIKDKSFEDWNTLRDDFATEPLSRPLRDMRMAELYADLILSVPNNSMLGVRPYQHFFLPVNLRDFEASVPERDVPVVVHAPSDKGVKGTRNILAALERLRAQGVAFDLRLMHGVPHQQVLVELSQADVAIDQLNLPLHGMFGLEGMASGCVLATCNREDYEPFPPNRPIWHIDAVNLESQLRQLLTNKEVRIRLAREGRKYVEQYHDHTEVARRVLDSLQGSVTEYDHYPTFFARSYKLENGEQIPEYLKRMTAAIVQRRGLPPDVDPHEMVQRGLMSADALTPANPVPRWNEHVDADTVTV